MIKVLLRYFSNKALKQASLHDWSSTSNFNIVSSHFFCEKIFQILEPLQELLLQYHIVSSDQC